MPPVKKPSKWDAVKQTVQQVLRIKNGWSFSRYAVYALCPAQARYKFIDKIPEASSRPMERGSLIHKQAECYIKGLTCPVLNDDPDVALPKLGRDGSIPAGTAMHRKGVLPPPLAKFADLFKEQAALYKKKAVIQSVEDSWAFTKDWESCSPTDWDRCWVRIKVDRAYEVAGKVLIIRDWKTGRFHDDLHEEYLKAIQLYALGGLLKYPHIKKVKPFLDYLDAGCTHPEEPLEYDRSDIPKLKKIWEDRVTPMFNDGIFAPRPNSKCTWCSYGASKGGPCKY